MDENELRAILKQINDALDVYRKSEGKLTAAEISVKSMISAAGLQIARQLAQQPKGERG